MARNMTGIHGLDEMLHGGFVRNDVVMIAQPLIAEEIYFLIAIWSAVRSVHGSHAGQPIFFNLETRERISRAHSK